MAGLVVLASSSLLAGVGTATAATSLSVNSVSAPAASGSFGATVVVLASGNVVVTDPLASTDGLTHNGAVYLYNGASRALISTLKGSHNEDQIGSGRVVGLANGGFAVASPLWDDGTSTDVGAVTWGSGTTGVSGTVSAANSVVGSHSNDNVGATLPVALPSGAYVIQSSLWDDGSGTDVGAITWASGTGTTVGVVSSANSLVGSHSNSKVGSGEVRVLSNGNYVVTSPDWNDGVGSALGAATWGPGTATRTGIISSSNSIVGSSSGDSVGLGGVTALSNGNYVVNSPYWANGGADDAGAATWGNGATGTSVAVSSGNSIVGSQSDDHVGAATMALTNGNFVTVTADWDSGGTTDAGAVTWGNGTTGTNGAVSSGNSIVGSQASDRIGSGGTIALANGNYVVGSPEWDGGASNTGAATWGNGASGSDGEVSSGNSLVGTHASDRVGDAGTFVPLSNNHYVVATPAWDNDTVADAGAVTWANGTTGTNGFVATTNSLVGTRTSDSIGLGGVVALTNGNYVVGSPNWGDGTRTLAGAATWASGVTPLVGTVTSTNSLVGTHDNDRVGSTLLALTNGNSRTATTSWAVLTGTTARTSRLAPPRGATGPPGSAER